MPGGHPRDRLGRHGGVGGHQCCDQAAATPRRKGDRVVQPVVGHERRHRAERLDLVHRGHTLRVGAAQQRRREEGATRDPFTARSEPVRAADQPLAVAHEPRHLLAHVALLLARGERADLHLVERRVAHHQLRESRAQGLGHRVDAIARHQRAADRRALLARLDRHLADHLAHEEVEFRAARLYVRPQDRAVERIGFGIEGNRAADQVRVRAQHDGRVGRAGEGHHVLRVQQLEQVAGTPDHQLQGAGRQQPRVVDRTHQRLGEKARGGGRLHDAGHTGQKARCELLQDAPDREVERVDVHGHAAPGHQHMRAGECILFADLHGRALVDQVARRQLGRRARGVACERADAAVDVHPTVLAGRPGEGGECVQGLLGGGQVLGQPSQDARPLLEVQRQQRRQPDLPGVGERRLEIDGVGVGVGDDVARDGTGQRLAGGRADPATGDQALEGLGHGGGFPGRQPESYFSTGAPRLRALR